MAGKTITVDKKFKGYFDGMNYYAARSLRVKFPYGRSDIAIVGGLSRSKRKWIKEHERTEINYMRRGLSYRNAHARTLLTMGDYKNRKDALRDADRNLRAARQK